MNRLHPQKPFRLIRIAFCAGLLVMPVSAPSQTGTATATVKEFYRFHFAARKRMHFSRQNIGKVKKWLTAELYGLMSGEFKREEAYRQQHPDEKPYFSGDVFTDSESPPQTFRIGKASQQKTRATVSLTVLWDDDTVGKMERQIEVQLLKQQGRWRIANLVYEPGRDLLSELKRPNYQ